MASVTIGFENYDKIKKALEQKKKAPEKVLQRTMSDIRKRAPGWVAAEIAAVYGAKKAEITGGKLGSVKVEGSDPRTAKIIYKGRMLTPTHFGMTPKAPGQNAYTLKAQIIRGQKSTLGKVKKLSKKQRKALGKNFTRQGSKSSPKSPIMLMHTGNAQAGGTNYIPFQRVSQRRSDIKAIKSISLPQMVSSERTAPKISAALNENVQKRLDHHMDRLMKE